MLRDPCSPGGPLSGLRTALRRPLTLFLPALNSERPSKVPGTARRSAGSRTECQGDDPDHAPRSFSLRNRPGVMVESKVREEGIIDEHRATEPVRAPSPTAPTAPAAETEAEVEAAPETEAESRVIERGIIAVNRRSPNVNGIIGWHIDYLWVGWLNDDDLLPPLSLSRDCLLWR